MAKHTRRSVKAAIRSLIMNSEDPALDHLHLYHALQDAEAARMKKDGRKPINAEAFVKFLGQT